MKKLILCLFLMMGFYQNNTINLNAYNNENEENFNDIELVNSFDLTNPKAQRMIVENEEGKIIYEIGPDLQKGLFSSDIYIKNGSFDRIFTASFSVPGSSVVIGARFKGTCNPYITTITKVSGGYVESDSGFKVRSDEYDWGTLSSNSDIGTGNYTINFENTYGGRGVAGLFVTVYPESPSSRAVVELKML